MTEGHNVTRFEWDSWAEDILDPDAMDKRLAQHLVAGARRLSIASVVGLATDKAWVGTLPLQNTVFLTGDNCAVLATPIVA